MLLADLSLARRVEAGEAVVGSESARALARIYPESGAAALPVAGGCALYVGAASPFNQASGVGMNGQVTEAELDQLESFYRGRGSALRIMLCPLADPSLVQLLGCRGYRLTEMENVLVRAIQGDEPVPPPAAGVSVRRAAPGEAKLWAGIIGEGFFGTAEPEPQLMQLVLAGFSTLNASCFFGCLDGRPVGAAVVHAHDGVAMLNGAATLQPYRGRGVHTALHHARLSFAAAAGCELARVVTQPGSASQRNAERQGFSVAYTRVAMVREWTPAAAP